MCEILEERSLLPDEEKKKNTTYCCNDISTLQKVKQGENREIVLSVPQEDSQKVALVCKEEDAVVMWL